MRRIIKICAVLCIILMTTSCDKLLQTIREGNYKIEINGKEYFNGNIIRHYTIADLSGKEGSDNLYLYCFDDLQGHAPLFFLRVPKGDRYEDRTYSIQTQINSGEHIFDFAFVGFSKRFIAEEGKIRIRPLPTGGKNPSLEWKAFEYDVTVVEIDRETKEIIPDGEQIKIHGEAKMGFDERSWENFVEDTHYMRGLFGRILSYL